MTLLLMLLLKSFFVFALSGAALLCLRRASASVRHLVCLLTLAALLALPLFSMTLPSWHVAGFSSTDQLLTSPTAAENDPPAPNNGGARADYAAAAPVLNEAPASRSAPAPPLLGAGGNPFPWPLLLLALYLLGVILAGLRPLLGLWGIARLRRACVSVTDAPTLSVSADCAAALRLTRRPQLCRADVPVPMTWGWRRPVVLLPSGSETWPEDRLRSVLLHEMAHLKRRDWTCHRLADAACALYWFHPLVWLTARRLRSESEIACDDLVLSSGVAAPKYARHLLEIAGALPRPLPGQSAIAMAQTPHIKRRITMILDKTQSRRLLTRRALLIAFIPSTAVLLILAALRPAVRAQAGPQKLLPSRTSVVPFVSPPSPRLAPLLVLPPVVAAATPASAVSVALVGITDGVKWWSPSGALLPQPLYDVRVFHDGKYDYWRKALEAGQPRLDFAFRVSPPAAQDVTLRFSLDDNHTPWTSSIGTWAEKMQGQDQQTEAQINRLSGGLRVYSVTYSAPPSGRHLSVSLASGLWTLAGDSGVSTFGPSSMSGASTDPNSGPANYVFSPLFETDGQGRIAISTNNTKSDLRVSALDAQGHILLPVQVGDNSGNGFTQIDARFALPAAQIKQIRIETRPFRQVEFKDVALQPVKK